MPGATPSSSPASPRTTTRATDIVFCGVHFMAESADVLTGDHQRVILPDLNAGCSMADMADIDQVEECWDALADVTDISQVVPITYMNSSAALKAFVGEHGGAVCTSSNARAVLDWALAKGSQGPVLPRPAPRPQHRLRHGLRRERHAGVEPALRARRPRGARRQGRDVPAVEGPLLGAPALPPRARRRVPGRAPRRHRDRAPRVRARRRGARRPGRLHRAHPRLGRERARRARSSASAPRSTWCSAWPPSTPTRRSCRSTRSSARARRCSASTARTSRGCSRPSSPGEVVNQITVDAETREWARVALQRMLDIT